MYIGLAANQPCDAVPPPLPGSRARRSYVRHEPRGLALVIGTWNFPLPLHLKPIITAIAAGCPSFLKCNDQCVETSAIMLRVLGEEYLEADPICNKYVYILLLLLLLLYFYVLVVLLVVVVVYLGLSSLHRCHIWVCFIMVEDFPFLTIIFSRSFFFLLSIFFFIFFFIFFSFLLSLQVCQNMSWKT